MIQLECKSNRLKRRVPATTAEKLESCRCGEKISVLSFNSLFFNPPVMFVLGLMGFVRGRLDGE